MHLSGWCLDAQTNPPPPATHSIPFREVEEFFQFQEFKTKKARCFAI
jgi:hypothetical protein